MNSIIEDIIVNRGLIHTDYILFTLAIIVKSLYLYLSCIYICIYVYIYNNYMYIYLLHL